MKCSPSGHLGTFNSYTDFTITGERLLKLVLLARPYDLWEERGLYRATPAVTGVLVYFRSLLKRLGH